MLEQVARSIAIAAIARKWPNAKSDFIAEKVDAGWKVYEPDARLVIATVNRLVEAEQFVECVEGVANVTVPTVFQ